jgi:hypothetical protein
MSKQKPCLAAGSWHRLAAMQPNLTVIFPLTPYQWQEIQALGEIFWPDQKLTHSELCRRVLLEGAQRMLASDIPGERKRLLEEACLPSPKA